MVNLSCICREPIPDANSFFQFEELDIKIMEFGLKWVHMARYELILRLDGALWLRIIYKPLPTPERHIKMAIRIAIREFLRDSRIPGAMVIGQEGHENSSQ